MISVDLLFKDEDTPQSKVLEWLVVNQLDAEFFWRDSYKNEVDIIKVFNEKIIPIEIKYGKIEIKGLLKFMDFFKLKKGYIITSNEEKKYEQNEKIIQAIPIYKCLIKNWPFL
jgi:predicted AAA+ superfamily ATPase